MGYSYVAAITFVSFFLFIININVKNVKGKAIPVAGLGGL
jgi:hypothetical protein